MPLSHGRDNLSTLWYNGENDKELRVSANWEDAEFSDLLGKTLLSCKRDGESITFETVEAEYLMFHEQDCCENVSIDDINGDIDNLVGSPITYAEVSSDDGQGGGDSETWTFYKIATVKGWVDIRWFGTSNGYYSEEVSFQVRQKPPLDMTSPDGIRYKLKQLSITTSDPLSPQAISEGQSVGFAIIDDVPSGYRVKRARLFCILRDESSVPTDDGKWKTNVYA